jgi:hypothetical protein
MKKNAPEGAFLRFGGVDVSITHEFNWNYVVHNVQLYIYKSTTY